VWEKALENDVYLVPRTWGYIVYPAQELALGLGPPHPETTALQKAKPAVPATSDVQARGINAVYSGFHLGHS